MNNLIVRNNKFSETGGGISLFNNSNAKMSNLSVYNNSAYTGGGISCEKNSAPEIFNSSIYNNSAIGGGGGIALEENCKANIQNDLIYNNTANYCGGGISCYNSDAIINNVSILNNHSNKGGGICLIVTSSPVITNSIIAYNTGNYGIENSTDYPGNPTISYCNFFGNSGQNFFNCNSYIGRNVTVNANKESCDAYYNIQTDPRCLDINNANYELTAESPCVDAGKNLFVNLNFDIKNNPRILEGNNNSNSIVDIGCYEFENRIATNLKRISELDTLLIYPNPFSSLIAYHLNDSNCSGIVEIVDINGKIVYSNAITSNVGVINLENSKSGNYLFRIVSNKVVKYKKIIKK